MATLQIIKSDRSHSDPTKDRRGSWKRGMILDVYEDGVCSAPPSPNSPTVFVHIPGVAAATIKDLIEPEREDDGEGKLSIKTRREFLIDWDSLPSNVKTALRDDREITVPALKLRDFIKRSR